MSSKKMIVAIIPAKGSSKRLPNKNMTKLLGKPLIQFTIDEALKSKSIDRLYISTDNQNIENYATSKNIRVIKRSEKLGGETPIIDVYEHAYNSIEDKKNIEIMVGLQPDHPDRDVSIDEALNIFFISKSDHLISVDAGGKKNGAHYIMSAKYITTRISTKTKTITDDATNIHFDSDIKRAEKRLGTRIK
tara:strand:- start:159 stop:728 length:570 start_codon:yes stop_codon:yes gene_type:complete